MNKMFLSLAMAFSALFSTAAFAQYPEALGVKKTGSLCPADVVFKQDLENVGILQLGNLVKKLNQEKASAECTYEVGFKVPEGTRLKISSLVQSYVYKLTRDSLVKLNFSVSAEGASASKEVSESNRLMNPITKVGQFMPDFAYASECFKEGAGQINFTIKNAVTAEGLLEAPVSANTMDIIFKAELEDCH